MRPCILLIALAAVLAVPVSASAATSELATGVYDLLEFPSNTEGNLALQRTKAAGAKYAKIVAWWREIAPITRPSGFDPKNPNDPAYRWTDLDTQIQLALANGLKPVVMVVIAPKWAVADDNISRPGTYKPSYTELASFGVALVKRYPDVNHWAVWNENNLFTFLAPQVQDGRLFAPSHYRKMVNAFSDAVHAQKPSSVVIAGELAPFGGTVRTARTPPKTFMRALLCINSNNRPIPGCAPLRANVWSTHPYTSGGPTHQANSPYDVSLGDLREMRAILNVAIKYRHIVSARPIEFWITEFSWDTRGVDPRGVPMRLAARWVSELAYRAKAAGVNTVIWFGLRDRPFPASALQGGLYFCGGATLTDEGPCADTIANDQAKGVFPSFRFPFVAYPLSGTVFVWGRTPGGVYRRVVIEHLTSRGWRAIGVLTPNAYGVFAKRFSLPWTRGFLRARLRYSTMTSVPFSLVRPADLTLSHPFGCGGSIDC